MYEEKDKIPLRIEVCMPYDDWRPRMIELLSRGNSGQLHTLIDKIPGEQQTRSRAKMKKSTRYHDRYTTYTNQDRTLTREFTETLDSILRFVPLPVLFAELMTWGYSFGWSVDVIEVTSGGMPRTK